MNLKTQIYKPPFPWFGGKSKVAHLVWERFGDVPNYVEPFFGSGAVMFLRPHEPNTETVNDADCYLTNFWRATKENPSEVAKHADNPVNEADLLARHKWLLEQGKNGFADKMKTDPHFYDTKIAGWWVWGICCWIGQGWCRNESNQLPHLYRGQGINRKLPHLGDQGRGIQDYFESLSVRLRRVRVACGDWTRVLGDSVTIKHGVTGIFLDPPYSADECDNLYSVNTGDIAKEVRRWAIENGNNPLMRIALCGYDTEHEMPDNWSKVFWKRKGGFEGQAKEKTKAQQDRFRETIWFSPHCLNSKQQNLF